MPRNAASYDPAWDELAKLSPEDRRAFWNAATKLFRHLSAHLDQERRERAGQRVRMVDHLESLKLLEPHEAEAIRERVRKPRNAVPSEEEHVRWDRFRKRARRFPSVKAKLQWVHAHFDAVFMYRVPFLLYPNGAFRISRPGANHMRLFEDYELVGPVEETEDSLGWDFFAGENFQGYIILHPEYGLIEQWPFVPGTLREQPWITFEMKENVRRRALRLYERYGPGTELHPSLERFPRHDPWPPDKEN